MTANQVSKWEKKRTDESRMVEGLLRGAGFERVDAYRYNSASLRVRVIDKRFESIPRDERDQIVEPVIDKLPPSTQSDIVSLVLLAPSEFDQPSDTLREFMLNTEFENPSPSML
ncbi:MAG: hypothetical protein ACI9G1_004935 [Pirellulaceae bacterium]|jgi:hypothetical protein